MPIQPTPPTTRISYWGSGKNRLGQILMKVRDELRTEEKA